eukprot:5292660-Prorocentrum_lima.AAC.1
MGCSVCKWGRKCAHVHRLSLWLPHLFVHVMGVRTLCMQPGRQLRECRREVVILQGRVHGGSLFFPS